MSFGWPQITFLALTMMGLGMNLALHGKSRGEYNFFGSIFNTAIVLSILWWGGFFGG